MNNLEKAIKTLLNDEPFYANFFLASKIVMDPPNLPTAAATADSQSTILMFNSAFINALTPLEVVGVVKHEILHLLFEHIYAYRGNSNLDKKLANICMDLAINQYIKDLPKGSVTLPLISAAIKKHLPSFQTWEYYYNEVIQNAGKTSGMVTMDDHSGFEKGEESSELNREVIKNTVGEAVKASIGNIPEGLQQVLNALKTTHKVPWQQVLANFVARSASPFTRSTRKKIHRRYGISQPGKVKKRELVLGFCVDSSGSISDENYEQFMSELVKVIQYCSKVYFVEADCVVQSVTTLTKKTPPTLTRSGRGGTAYQPAISKCLELGCDAIIYLGDFDTSDTPKNPGKPFLWVGVGTSPKPGNFGSEIRI